MIERANADGHANADTTSSPTATTPLANDNVSFAEVVIQQVNSDAHQHANADAFPPACSSLAEATGPGIATPMTSYSSATLLMMLRGAKSERVNGSPMSGSVHTTVYCTNGGLSNIVFFYFTRSVTNECGRVGSRYLIANGHNSARQRQRQFRGGGYPASQLRRPPTCRRRRLSSRLLVARRGHWPCNRYADDFPFVDDIVDGLSGTKPERVNGSLMTGSVQTNVYCTNGGVIQHSGFLLDMYGGNGEDQLS